MNRRTALKLIGGAGGLLAFSGLFELLKHSGKLDVSVHFRHVAHEVEPINALIAGLKLYGITPRYGETNVPCGSDVAIMWSWFQPQIVQDAKRRGKHVLVVERGFIQPRMEWCSLAFDGFNGRGRFPPAADNGERWEKNFAQNLQPWHPDQKGYALIIGQRSPNAWDEQMGRELTRRNLEVVYRPHPMTLPQYLGNTPKRTVPAGTRLSNSSLAEDLAGASFCVIYSSTAGVESILAGVPSVIMDEGSVAYPLGSHDLNNPFYYPDRTQWCHDMAWRQWTLDEFANGFAWEHVRTCI